MNLKRTETAESDTKKARIQRAFFAFLDAWLRLLMLNSLFTSYYEEIWRPLGGSNPCYRRERAVS